MTRLFAATFAILLALWAPAALAQTLDATPRIAVVSAFEPEWTALRGQVQDRQERTVNGVRFVTGMMAGKPVVVFLSGVSMVNATMTTQLALDRFTISKIVFSGIAGGVDPSLDVGDVVVPERWAQYLEATFARQTGKGRFAPVERYGSAPSLANYGMIYPEPVQVLRDGAAAPESKLWFEADPALLAVARQVAGQASLKRCIADRCLVKAPRVVVGGAGVSGAAFVDNAQFRKYAFATFKAQVLDMETAAVGHVAYANGTPFIAFRSLSDLAGGDPGKNQARIFFQLAADNSAAVVTAFLTALP